MKVKFIFTIPTDGPEKNTYYDCIINFNAPALPREGELIDLEWFLPDHFQKKMPEDDLNKYINGRSFEVSIVNWTKHLPDDMLDEIMVELTLHGEWGY